MILADAIPSSAGLGALAEWRLDPITLVAIGLAGWWYAARLRRVRRAGRPFPAHRAVAFFAGLVALLAALVSPLDAYAEVLLTIHMAQHLVLVFVAAPLLALGAPVDLMLRAAGRSGRRRAAPLLRSRVGRLAVHPATGWVALVGVTYGVHFTGLYEAALRDALLHAVEHALFFVGALLFWWPIVGVDPLPRTIPHPIRMLSLLLVMPAMSFAALAIFSAGDVLYTWYAELPAPWGSGALADQRNAAVLMWVAGNLALVVAILVVAGAWKRVEDARQRRIEARIDGPNGHLAAPAAWENGARGARRDR